MNKQVYKPSKRRDKTYAGPICAFRMASVQSKDETHRRRDTRLMHYADHYGHSQHNNISLQTILKSWSEAIFVKYTEPNRNHSFYK